MKNDFFSKNIRFLRESLGLKLSDFEQYGIKTGTLSNYELGKTEPKLETLMFFSKFFKTQIDTLLLTDLSVLSKYANGSLTEEESAEYFEAKENLRNEFKNLSPIIEPNNLAHTNENLSPILSPKEKNASNPSKPIQSENEKNDGVIGYSQSVCPECTEKACTIDYLREVISTKEEVIKAKEAIIQAKETTIASKDDTINALKETIRCKDELLDELFEKRANEYEADASTSVSSAS